MGDPEPNLITSGQVLALMRDEAIAFLNDEDVLERMAAFGHMNLTIGFLACARAALIAARGEQAGEGRLDSFEGMPMIASLMDTAYQSIELLMGSLYAALAVHPDGMSSLSSDIESAEEDTPPLH